jgi:hypothetical protein
MVVVLAVVGCGGSAFRRWSPARGLSVPTPAGFHTYRSVGGVAISDLSRHEVFMPYLESDDEANIPSYLNGVVLFVGGASYIPPILPPLRLPIGLDELPKGGWGGRGGNFVCAQQVCRVWVWLGPKAPARDRAAVLEALASIKFRRGAT